VPGDDTTKAHVKKPAPTAAPPGHEIPAPAEETHAAENAPRRQDQEIEVK
jgi:hypothetical protein